MSLFDKRELINEGMDDESDSLRLSKELFTDKKYVEIGTHLI